ncbi:MAG: citrate lyase [Mycobacterium sp.]|jgi:citrate lyase subunit beta/citryl-CoA lyase|nr:citrate lyase [Mycobacterium sp.]MDT5366871.1 citrate lyase subunit beta / citryl-CoA lyase [Mycobacterium sp.]
MIGLTEARSLLFVPGTRSDLFDHAVTSGAGAVIFDLEDSVAPSEKTSARTAVSDWLTMRPEPGACVAVRVNASDTPWHGDDLRMVATAGCAVVLPKTDRVDTVVAVRTDLPHACPLIALVETARGVHDVAALCRSQSVDRVAFGSVDFAVELGLDPAVASATLTHARSVLVVASAAAGLPPPIDGVTVAVDDDTQLTIDLAAAVSLGFGGKLAIHPRQVAAINAAWTPAPALVSWAKRVIAAACPNEARSGDGSGEPIGVTVVDGQMVDLPVVTRARRILARAAEVTRSTTEHFTTANGTT